MKLIVMADTHLGFNTGKTAVSRRLMADHMFNSFKSVLEYSKSRNADFVLHAGDFFNRSKPSKFEIKRSMDEIVSLLDEDIGFAAVPGNHDKARLPDSLFHFLYDNFHFFNRLGEFSLGEINLIGFPFEYLDPPEVFRKAVKMAERNTQKNYFIMCHQLFFGASFGPHRFTFRNQPGVINPQRLPSNVNLVLSGHIHRPQRLFDGKVIYTGSTARTGYEEILEPKGFIEIDIEEDHIQTKHVEITSFPMQIIEYDLRRRRVNFSELEDLIINHHARIYVRFCRGRLHPADITKLYQNFSSRDYPYFSFTPKATDKILTSLFFNYSDEFNFSEKTLFNNSPSSYQVS